MLSYFESESESASESASQADSSIPETVNTFPIQRLPNEILSRIIDVGSWNEHILQSDGWGHWITDTKPRQKDFVRLASQVCCRWHEIVQWRGHPHRWCMRLSFSFYEGDSNLPHELSQFRQGLRASDGCDLLLRLASTGSEPDADAEYDDPTVVQMQLFMHGIKMLLPYLQQILVLEVEAPQSDPLHLLFVILHRWTTKSCLTSLKISHRRMMRELPSSLLDYQLLGLPKNRREDDMPSHSLPSTLIHVHLDSVSLPESFAFPYGLTHLDLRDSHYGIDFHSFIPHSDQLTFLHMDLWNEAVPITAFRLDSLVTFIVETNLTSFLGWSQTLYAKNLQTLDLAVLDEEPFDFSPPSAIARSSPPLSPTLLNVSCAVGALRTILSCLAFSNLVKLKISFKDNVLPGQEESQGMELYSESISLSGELVFPLVLTLTIWPESQPWSRTMECVSFPVLEYLSCRRSTWEEETEARDFTEWISFSSHHERKSFNNLVTLDIWLPAFEASQIHPLEYVPNIVEPRVQLRESQSAWPKDWDMWMVYPGPRPSLRSPPLTRLRTLVVIMPGRYVERDISLEDELEAKIHGIQASRVQRGVGLEIAWIQWETETTEFRQNVTTGFLERLL